MTSHARTLSTFVDDGATSTRDLGQLLIAKRQTARKVKAAPREPLCNGASNAVKEPHTTEHRLFVQRPEKRASTNAAGRQPFHRFIGIKRYFFSEDDAEHPINALGVRCRCKR